ncbi:DUF4232 domain-containing protein [Streptomyces acidiscabies]|uniref:DUF4232 domain-containing protein n=1 Tax=Streptomyces acidiscabies TaxID=42234 RepID=A0AAP6EG36_9ACTN|nr:DUF4232 domain-containing protein [Streptomyces acidiscabies]MBP5938118.1 DUF4232 domain-containing protein [Streptomyces sp. LBUM 1476]MBZ3909128.1 DUF4232 domain-containing protein [Streptomyces acidiscabies]MDX2961667.1 DUF4232 domain-containing protein [Streptomyces acidiscabies]MDX3016464.1 DUF4232 domain-containing protein [Streptomyces acidiscabies]MDX3788630.1 DUF4232 domain-containing protein [Streptomyces acidiscabies]
MRVQKLTIAAVAVAAGLSLTACGSSDSTAKSDPSSPASNSAATTGGSGTSGSTTGGSGTAGSATGGTGSGSNTSATNGGSGSSGSTTGGSGSNSAAKSGRCGADSLTITASDNTIKNDSTRTVVVTLKNKSGKSCTISGFAGVDLKTSSGTISAKRSGQPNAATTLKSGAEVFFPVFYPANDSGGSGVRITGLLVTPPNDTRTVSLAWPGAASLPVTEGGGASVEVGPIDSAGQGS